MQEHRKVYPSGRSPGRWLGWSLLILALFVVLSGLVSGDEDGASISPLPTATPFPLDEQFDETMETQEWYLPEVEWYALQLGAFDNEDSARSLSEQYQGRGAAGYLWQDERYRVLAAIYAGETDARNVRQQIDEQHGVDSYLFRIDLPAIGVSIHGMRGQIEILQAAFLHATDLIAALQNCSLHNDRSEMTREEVRASLLALKDQTSLVSLRMQQRFPEPRDASVAGLIGLFDDYAAFCDTIVEEDAEVLFGSRLKHQTIRSLDLLRQVYDILGNT